MDFSEASEAQSALQVHKEEAMPVQMQDTGSSERSDQPSQNVFTGTKAEMYVVGKMQ